jgi:hypothetical protein
MRAYALIQGTRRVTIINASTLIEAWERALGAVADAVHGSTEHYGNDRMEDTFTLEPLGYIFGSE